MARCDPPNLGTARGSTKTSLICNHDESSNFQPFISGKVNDLVISHDVEYGY